MPFCPHTPFHLSALGMFLGLITYASATCAAMLDPLSPCQAAFCLTSAPFCFSLVQINIEISLMLNTVLRTLKFGCHLHSWVGYMPKQSVCWTVYCCCQASCFVAADLLLIYICHTGMHVCTFSLYGNHWQQHAGFCLWKFITTDVVCPSHTSVFVLGPNPGCVRLQMGVEGRLSVVSHGQVAPVELKAPSAAVPSPSGSRSALQERIRSAERRAVQMMLNKTRAISQEVSVLCMVCDIQIVSCACKHHVIA